MRLSSRIGCFLLLITVMVSADCNYFLGVNRPLPSDAAMEANLRQHKDDFIRLVDMFQRDANMLRIDFDWTHVVGESQSSKITGDPGITEERWNEYRSLFRKLGLNAGINRDPINGTLIFYAFGKGLGVSGVSKGYYYSAEPLECSINQEDDLNKYLDGVFCKKLEVHWYMYISS